MVKMSIMVYGQQKNFLLHGHDTKRHANSRMKIATATVIKDRISAGGALDRKITSLVTLVVLLVGCLMRTSVGGSVIMQLMKIIDATSTAKMTPHTWNKH